MKKSQVSVFVIIGLTLLLVMSIYMFFTSKNNERIQNEVKNEVISLNDVNIDSRNYINSCIRDSVKQSIEDTGIREEKLNEYKNLVSDKISNCTLDLFLNLKKMGYDIIESNIIIEAVFEKEIIGVTVIYPIVISHEGQKIEFSNFNYVFDRTATISLPNGIAEKDIKIVSSNRKAEIKIKKGTKVTDKNGNPIDTIGIRVEDAHFNNLNNGYVLGEIVYDNFPDVLFSEPVEFSIEFREKDIPINYTKENLMIAFYDENDKIWYAVNTVIEENRAKANITHFSIWSISILDFFKTSQTAFKNRFNPAKISEKSHVGQWLLGPNVGDIRTITLQLDYYRDSFVNPDSLLQEGSIFYDLKDENIDGIYAFGKSIHFEDFKEYLYLNKNKFLNMPLIEYGYYKDTFIPCEPSEEMEINGIKYYSVNSIGAETSGNENIQVDFPYLRIPLTNNWGSQSCGKTQHFEFKEETHLCNTFCISDHNFNLDIEMDDETANELINTCCIDSRCNDRFPGALTKDGKSMCLPSYPSNNPELYCTATSLNELKNNEDYKDIFGYHDFKCMGGRILKGDREEKPFFFESKPNGDAIIFGISTEAKSESLNVLCKTSEITYFKTKSGNLAFGVDYVEASLDNIELKKEEEEDVEFGSLNVKCNLDWFFIGNGLIPSTPPDLTITLKENQKRKLNSIKKGFSDN